MALEITVPDKILAGLNQSYTITSDSGPPSGKVLVSGFELPHRIVPLGPPKESGEPTAAYKYKVTFLLPSDSAGKKLELRFQAGESRTDDTHEITRE